MAKMKTPLGYVEVEFISDFGSYVKGEKIIYHKSTADTLVDKKIVKVTEVIKNYIPKGAKK